MNTNSASRVTRSEPQCIIMQTARDEELVGKWNRQRVPRPTSIQAQTYCTLGLYVCKREGRTTMRRKKENGENEKESEKREAQDSMGCTARHLSRNSAICRIETTPVQHAHTHTPQVIRFRREMLFDYLCRDTADIQKLSSFYSSSLLLHERRRRKIYIY